MDVPTGPTIVLPVPARQPPVSATEAPLRLADSVLVLQSLGSGGVWCTIKGLGRFGLPELQILDVPPRIGVPWAAALTGIALRLLERWFQAIRGGPAFAEIPALIEFTADDVARAYTVEGNRGGRPAMVQLRLDPAPNLTSDSFLTIGPPDGIPGSTATYLTLVCDALFDGSHP